MGWYLRKSFGFGPLRLNLSKSGLGYSVGVRGARIGVGPRGNYIRLGRGGVYYQKYFSPSTTPASEQPSVTSVVEAPQLGTPVTTAHASEFHDSTSESLLNEIRQKHQKTRIAPLFAIASAIVVLGLLSAKVSRWAVVPLVPVFALAHAAIGRRDWEEKLVLLNYDLDNEARALYIQLLSAMQTFASSARIWRVTSVQSGVDRKYHAGANTVLDKKVSYLRLALPSGFHTRVAVWAIQLRGQTLYFFPDRILVFEGSQVGAISYDCLSVTLGQTRFVEDDDVPSDAQVVDRTWRYVNKNGTPDRRFANNRQLPVVLYAQLNISSQSGLNIALESSNPSKAAAFKAGLDTYISGCHMVVR